MTENEVNAYLALDALDDLADRRRESDRHDSRPRPSLRPRRRRPRRGAQGVAADEPARSEESAHRAAAVTASGVLTTSNGVGDSALESASRWRLADAEGPAAGDPQLLLAHAGEARAASTSTIRFRCPRTSAKFRSPRSGHRRSMNASDEVLATPLQFLKGVGPRRAADLEHVGLLTLEDLLYRFPIRYEDRSRLQAIASLQPGQTAAVAGRLLSCGLRSTRRPGFKIFDAVVDDGTASIRVSWLNQAFLRDVFSPGSARRLVRSRRDARLRRTSADQPAVRDPGRRGRRDDSHRAHRPCVREERAASRRRCSGASCTTRCRRLPPATCRICCRSPCASDSGCRRGRRRFSPRTFRRPTRRSTT